MGMYTLHTEVDGPTKSFQPSHPIFQLPTMVPDFEVLVIGAGVAGCCAIAAAFARQGRRVLVLERALGEPDRSCRRASLGIQARSGRPHCLSGIDATPVAGYHLFSSSTIFFKSRALQAWNCIYGTSPGSTCQPRCANPWLSVFLHSASSGVQSSMSCSFRLCVEHPASQLTGPR